MARKSKRRKRRSEHDEATRNFHAAVEAVQRHPMFAPLAHRVWMHRHEHYRYPVDGWAYVSLRGDIHAHPTRRGAVEEWKYVLAHCLLHLGMEHFAEHEKPRLWQAACDCVVTRFLAGIRFGRPPEELRIQPDIPKQDERDLYRRFCDDGLPPELSQLGVAGSMSDMLFEGESEADPWSTLSVAWSDLLSIGIAESVSQALEVAAGQLDGLTTQEDRLSNAQRAKRWFMSSYPLLGALAESFKLIEEAPLCQRMGISVAAVNIEEREIYVNPASALSLEESRFVIAHELLHVGLRHDVRRRGRDAYLWNIACDYVINGWLIEMQVGVIPAFGLLHDPELKGMSAETIYERIARDLRKYRKLATLAGVGACDMLTPKSPEWWMREHGLTLDEFYRNCMARGLMYHEEQNRGFLPAGLIEEIRALEQPAIPWDVELARWFDGRFTPIEKRRTFARPSRRQASTPDIPRPRWFAHDTEHENRTFGVVVDTSGSMSPRMLGKSLGAIASYAESRVVQQVRVVFCDAQAYDQGYMAPDEILGRVKVRGRGGTILQPGIDLLERADDFPRTGPVLVITDGWCDRVRVQRDHAYLMPEGATLPFPPKGPVFRMK